jgi:hypothetical protein
MWNHSCEKGTKNIYRMKSVELSQVVNHHYRRSCAASYQNAVNGTKPVSNNRINLCNNNIAKPVMDNYAGRFRDYLLPKVWRVAEKLQLNLTNHY